MINMRLLAVLSAVISVSYSFAVNYTVKGNVSGMDGKMLYMHDYDRKVNIDSTYINNGSFVFEGIYDRPAYVRIENGVIFSNCVLDTLAVLDFDTHMPSSGSGLNRKLIDMMDRKKSIQDELQSFAKELKAHGFEQPELGDIYQRLFVKLRPGLIKIYTDCIDNEANGVGEAAVMSFGGMYGLAPEEWDSVYSRMPSYLKERETTAYFNNMFDNKRKSQPGKPFIDLNAKTIAGKEAMLSDYIGKGKYVLVDFWASWCGPCRKEAESTLRPLYEKYKNDDKFQILGVATWDNPDNTLKALEKLQYPWPQLIDAGQEPMHLYGFDGIPMIFLFGPDGIILERDLRGEKLIEAVDSYLSDKRQN